MRARQGLVALPAIGAQSPGPRILQAVEAATRATDASFKDLAKSASIAGAGVLALAVVLSRVSEELDEARNRTAAALSANQQYYEFIATASRQDIQNRLAELRRVQPALQAEADSTSRAVDSFFTQLVGSINEQFGLVATGPQTDLLARLLLPLVDSDELNQARERSSAALQTNIDLISRFEATLDGLSLVTGEVALSTEQLNKIREQELQLTRQAISAQAEEIVERSRTAVVLATGSRDDVEAALEAAQEIADERHAEIRAIRETGTVISETTGITQTEFRNMLDAAAEADADVAELVARLESIKEAEAASAIADAVSAIRDAGQDIQQEAENAFQTDEISDRLGRLREAYDNATEAGDTHAANLARLSIIDLQVSSGLQALLDIRQEELGSIYERYDAINSLTSEQRAAIPGLSEEIEELTNREVELRNEMQLIRELYGDEIVLRGEMAAATLEYLEAQETLRQGIEDMADNLLQAGEDAIEAAQDLDKARAALEQLNQDEEAKLLKARKDADSAILKARNDARGDETEAEEESNRKRLEAQRDFNRRIQEIERETAKDLTEARRTRDVVGAIRALERDAEARKKAKDQLDDRLEDIQDNLEKEQEAIDESLEGRLKAIRDSLKEEENDTRASFAKQRAVREQAVRAAEVALRNAENARAAIQSNYNNLAETEDIRHYGRLQSNARLGMNAIEHEITQSWDKIVGKIREKSTKIDKDISKDTLPGKGFSGTGQVGSREESDRLLRSLYDSYMSGGRRTGATTLNIYAPDSTRTIENVSRQQALQVVRDVWGD
jgi:hypothetical protein